MKDFWVILMKKYLLHQEDKDAVADLRNVQRNWATYLMMDTGNWQLELKRVSYVEHAISLRIMIQILKNCDHLLNRKNIETSRWTILSSKFSKKNTIETRLMPMLAIRKTLSKRRCHKDLKHLKTWGTKGTLRGIESERYSNWGMTRRTLSGCALSNGCLV